MDAIRYAVGEYPSSEQLTGLYPTGPEGQADRAQVLERAVRQSPWVATAWHEEKLVGLIRVLTDGVFVAYLEELRVHPQYQHQGIVKELLDRFEQTFGGFPRQVAVTDAEWAKSKLGKRGFRSEPSALSRVHPFADGATSSFEAGE